MWLVLPVAFDEGWMVEVDGERVATERVDFNRLGVRVEGGRSRLVATYYPPGWRVGLAGTTLGGFVVVPLLVPRRRRFRVPRVAQR